MLNEQEVISRVMRVTDLKKEISKAIIGQDEVINQVVLAMLSGGNVLLEGVPGLGKTQLIKTLSSASITILESPITLSIFV